jgi:hypothetical protein
MSGQEFFDVQVLIRLVAASFVLMVSLTLNSVSQVLIERHYLRHALRQEVRDLGFEFLPYLKQHRIPDFFLMGGLSFIIGSLILFHPKRTQVIRRFLILASCIFLIRGFTIIATILPNPLHECKPDPISGSDKENVLYESFRVNLGRRVTCGDCFFSAHTASLHLGVLLGNRFGRHFFPNKTAWKIVLVFLWFFGFLTYTLILCTHFHYTIDVVTAVVLTTLLWNWYHSYLKYIDRLPFWHPIAWLEFDSRSATSPVSKARDVEETMPSALDDPDAPLIVAITND